MKEMKIIHKILITSALLTSICFANVIRVPEDYPTIQLGINNASNGDTVLVGDGTYTETEIKWSGKHLTIKSKNGASKCKFFTSQAVFHFDEWSGQNFTDVIDGFSFTTVGESSSYGSVISLGGKVGITLQNCVFSDCYNPSDQQGVITLNYGGVILNNCQFLNNHGMIIWGWESAFYSTSFDSCFFYNNYSESYGNILINSNLIISNSTFICNRTQEHGGVIFEQWNKEIKINNSLFYDNESLDNSYGSIIYSSSPGKFYISNSTFDSNPEKAIWIGYSNTPDNIEILNCNFINNSNAIINNNTNTFLDAENNWWGSSTGPYHPTYNPVGSGDSVNINVDVIPFLTSPDTVAPPTTIQNLSIDTIGIDFVRLKWDSSLIGDLKGYRLYVNESPTVYEFSDTFDVGNDTVYNLNNLNTGSKYYVSVTCYDNSGDESWFTKTLEVKPSPVSLINAESDQIDFGTVIVGDMSQKSLVIHNTGTADLNISNITTTSSEFTSLDTVLTILPNSQKELRIAYLPIDFGFDTVNMAIFSDAYNFSEYTITLIGFGDLSPKPEILSIFDVPDDQGGNVRISFSRSKYDGFDSTQKVVSYTIWRLIEENEWDAVGMFNAAQDSFYNYVAPTLGDSTVHGIVWSTFKVSAHTENPDVFFFSDSLAGYSIDNIAPSVPAGLLASSSDDGILLTWQSNDEKDFQYYGIYRSTQSNFNPDTMEASIYVTSDTFYTDSDILKNTSYYYRISAFDYAGNQSDFSLEVNAIVVGIRGNDLSIPSDYLLSQNYPNPFNPTTTISYQLPKSSFVKLIIYDINGKLIETLVNENKNAGYYSVEWNANKVCSGIYFYRIDTGEFTCVKKCLIVK